MSKPVSRYSWSRSARLLPYLHTGCMTLDKHFDQKILLLIIAAQALFFCSFYSREIAWYPPENWDQTTYLCEAYTLQEAVLSKGFGEFWRALSSPGHPSGLGLPIEGAVSGLMLDGARLPQLCVNFIAFVALQVVVFRTGRFIGGRRVSGYALLGLILCETTPWFWAGGLFDFRMDFFAYCLYGIWACQVIQSNLLLNRRRTIWSALIGAFLIIHRFLTIIYILGVCIGFAAVCIGVSFFWRSKEDLMYGMRRRFYNLALFVAILAALVSPILMINRAAIHQYYVIGHAVGAEKDIRARGEGLVDLAGHLLYYPKSILRDHLGPAFLWGSAIVIASSLIASLLARRNSDRVAEVIGQKETFLLQIIFLAGAILGPIVVLTVDIAKSPVVGGVIGVPTALLVFVFIVRAVPKHRESNPSLVDKFVIACSLGIFGLGLANEFQHLNQHLPQHAQSGDLRRLAELDKWLVEYASEQGWTQPGISFDVISGWFNATAITASGFEQTKKLVTFHPLLGAGLMGVEQPEALSLLKNSDFLILTTQPKQGQFPFYQKIARYWDDLKDWADKNMVLARTVLFDRFTTTVYIRPTARISGVTGDWMTTGLWIQTLYATLQRFPKIQLRGSTNYAAPKSIPALSAIIDTQRGPQVVPASVRCIDNEYEILIDASSAEPPASEIVYVRLEFDTASVPNQTDPDRDTPRLVFRAPSVVKLMPAEP